MLERSDARSSPAAGVRLPWLMFALLVLGLAAAFVQGVRMARDRHQRLLPARAAAVLHAGDTEETRVEPREGARFLGLDLSGVSADRVGLYQLFPERSLVRWIETSGTRSGSLLVIPLEGLQPGHYAVTRTDPSATAGPRELDRPLEQLDVLARFQLERGGG